MDSRFFRQRSVARSDRRIWGESNFLLSFIRGGSLPPYMSPKLAGRVSLITGASGEIGGAVAVEFAREGATGISLHYNSNRRKAVEVAAAVRKLGSRGVVLRANISSPAQAKSLVTRTCAKFGRLDILVCVAGHPFLKEDWFCDFGDLTVEQLRNPIDVDLLGNAYVVQAAIRHMKRRRSGKIVFIGSTPAITGDSFGITYLVAKAGLLALTRALAQHLGPHNIRVNALALGSVDSKATLGHLNSRQKSELAREAALGRFGTPLEVARKVVFLSGDDSDFITGQTLIVDGGYAMR